LCNGTIDFITLFDTVSCGRLHPKRRPMPANPYTFRFSSLEEEAFVDSLLVDILPCCARKSNSFTGHLPNSFAQ
jgi:hypothetical protein